MSGLVRNAKLRTAVAEPTARHGGHQLVRQLQRADAGDRRERMTDSIKLRFQERSVESEIVGNDDCVVQELTDVACDLAKAGCVRDIGCRDSMNVGGPYVPTGVDEACVLPGWARVGEDPHDCHFDNAIVEPRREASCFHVDDGECGLAEKRSPWKDFIGIDHASSIGENGQSDPCDRFACCLDTEL